MNTLYNINLSVFQIVILGIFIVTFLIQICYYLFLIRRIVFYKLSASQSTQTPVSVIICSQNEGNELNKNLSYFLTQNYPTYEVVVVDDCSDDETQIILNKYKQEYPNLRSTIIKPDQKFKHNIKLAITIGIKAAKYDQLLFSTPYCRPSNPDWLQHMQANFSSKETVIQGYSNIPYKREVITQIIRYDIFFETLKRYCFALCGMSYAGTGNNMGYSKDHFMTQKGFARNAHTPNGYDHLMIQNLGRTGNTAICYHPEGKMENLHPKPFRNWVESYRNYFGSRKYLSHRFRFLLDLEPLSRIFFHISFFILLFNSEIILFTSPLYILRLILFFTLIKIVTSHLKEEKLFLSSYINDILVLFLKLYLYLRTQVFERSK